MKAATSQEFQNPIFFGSFFKILFCERANRCALKIVIHFSGITAL